MANRFFSCIISDAKLNYTRTIYHTHIEVNLYHDHGIDLHNQLYILFLRAEHQAHFCNHSNFKHIHT